MLKVIGAGFGRTGTKTLKDVLEQLGFGPCYHMYEVHDRPADIDVWRKAADGELPDWDRLFQGFNAGVDWPICNFWKELSEHYPDARFILSERDPEAWFGSISKTIFETFRIPPEEGSEFYSLRQMTRALIYRNIFDEDVENKAHVLAAYARHNEAVKAGLPAARLLSYDPSEGWEPLCAFLDVPVPREPFPHTNTTQDFRERAGFDEQV